MSYQMHIIKGLFDTVVVFDGDKLLYYIERQCK